MIMDAIGKSTDNGNAVVSIAGLATIDTAASIHRLMIEALDRGRSIVVDISGISQCDVTFLQLLTSLNMALKNGGYTLKIDHDNVPAVFCGTARVAGFQCGEICGHCPIGGNENTSSGASGRIGKEAS
jgi:ABC-type transporter Mla MlaB component